VTVPRVPGVAVPAITKVLVANRAEIARRIFRTARANGLETVAVFSDADEAAPFVAEADEAVRLPGSAPADTYLRSDLIVGAALRTGADAIHPGYGFLSENAAFARACAEAGLVFVGPAPSAIEVMGSKTRAKQVMAAAGVPVLSGVEVSSAMSGPDLARAVGAVGYPALVKAAYGGGGRGMRVVAAGGDLAAAVEGAEREAAAAFGDGTVFVERYVTSARHVEVQVFGDRFGNVIHLFERDCTIQRRHQKVIEEAPSPAVDATVRDALCAAAVAAARAIGYVGAGTVEFVLEPDGRFWFLEVNTRLQVEHPVTELVTGLDLVELQLRVAAGEPLPSEALGAALAGHAVEARLYAEDVPAGFVPATGTLHRLLVPGGPGIRVDAGYEDGSVVPPYYDAMLAKVLAWGPTRAAALRRLADTLARAEIAGVATNRDLLVRVLRHPDVAAGRYDTGFLERHPPEVIGAALAGPEARRLHAAAACVYQVAAGPDRAWPAGVPAGWRNVGVADQPLVLEAGDDRVEVVYRHRDGGPEILVDGAPLAGLRIGPVLDRAVDVETGGVRRRYRVDRAGAAVYVHSPLGSSVFREADRFPAPAEASAAGSLLSPMPGTVLAVAVAPGDKVAAGQLLVTLEAMKMEHAVRAPYEGLVTEVRVAAGDQVEPASTLVVLARGKGER
jgi:acetyl/propionyl-CoA carboxylase alpha subunit